MRCEGEKTYSAPGKCPKCGMEMVPTVTPDAVRMKLDVSPEKPEAGKPAKLTFTATLRKDGSLVKDLEVVHEKKIHLFLVSQDLSWFEHVHPEGDSEGRYHLDATFPAGGNYIAIADFTPKGYPAQASFHPLQAAGAPSQRPLPSRAKKSEPKKDRVWSRVSQEDFVLNLELPKDVKAGVGTSIRIKVQKNGKPVEGLENYLGALGHCVGIHEDLSEYLHAHPPHGVPPKKISEIEFHATFPKPGRYGIWVQFKHGGRLWTWPFAVRVP